MLMLHCLWTTAVITMVDCGNVLFLALSDSASHRKAMLPLADLLAESGHNVTMFGEYVQDGSGKGEYMKNLLIKIEFSMEKYKEKWHELIWKRECYDSMDMVFFWNLHTSITRAMLKQNRDQFDQLFNTDWDLVFVDGLFDTTGVLFTALSKSLYVLYETTIFGSPEYLDRSSPFPISYFPPMFPQSYSYDHKKFLDRLSSFWNEVKYSFAIYLVDRDIVSEKKFGPGVSVSRLYRKAEGLFIGYPMGPDYTRPKTHDSIEIAGGCKSVTLMEANLLDFIQDESSKGTIIIAFGHWVKWDQAPADSKENIAKAINLLSDYRVIWQIEGDPPMKMGAHVRSMGWLPQNELLHHNKTKVFVSHGGLKSVMEAICSQVPMVMVPMFAEQIRNWFILKRVNAGLVLDKHRLTVENIFESIKSVASNDSYRLSMMNLKWSLLDRPISSRDNGLFWTNFMIRHKGLPKKYFRLKSYKMGWIKYFCLDIIFIYTFIFLFVSYTFIRLLRSVIQLKPHSK